MIVAIYFQKNACKSKDSLWPWIRIKVVDVSMYAIHLFNKFVKCIANKSVSEFFMSMFIKWKSDSLLFQPKFGRKWSEVAIMTVYEQFTLFWSTYVWKEDCYHEQGNVWLSSLINTKIVPENKNQPFTWAKRILMMLR